MDAKLFAIKSVPRLPFSSAASNEFYPRTWNTPTVQGRPGYPGLKTCRYANFGSTRSLAYISNAPHTLWQPPHGMAPALDNQACHQASHTVYAPRLYLPSSATMHALGCHLMPFARTVHSTPAAKPRPGYPSVSSSLDVSRGCLHLQHACVHTAASTWWPGPPVQTRTRERRNAQPL